MLIHGLDKNKIPDKPGIYWIHHCVDGNFVPICRAAKPDPDGIIYIGSSKNIRTRIWIIRRVIFNDCDTDKGHVAANRYVRNAAIYKKFPPANLWIKWRKTENYEPAEAAQLLTYLKEYAELPPLNYSAPYNSLSKKLGKPVAFPLPDETA